MLYQIRSARSCSWWTISIPFTYNAHIFMLIWCTALLLIKWFIESIFFCFFLISTENIIKSIFPPRDRNSLTKYSQVYVCDDHGIEFVIIFLFMPNRNCVYKEHLLHTMLVTMLCVYVLCVFGKSSHSKIVRDV